MEPGRKGRAGAQKGQAGDLRILALNCLLVKLPRQRIR